MLDAADSRLLAERPRLSLVGRLPHAAPGVVPPCGEVHPMARVWSAAKAAPDAERRSLACVLPAGHVMSCGCHVGDEQWSASNAVQRRAHRNGE